MSGFKCPARRELLHVAIAFDVPLKFRGRQIVGFQRAKPQMSAGASAARDMGHARSKNCGRNLRETSPKRR
jgi:hypothetical protein